MKKIEEIIEYFKIKREVLYQEYLKEDYHQKQTIGITTAIFAGMVALISPLMAYFFIKEISGLLFGMISLLLTVLVYNIFHFVYVSWRIEKRYFTKIIKIDVILEFLWHIKITENDKEIDVLVCEFSKGLKDYRRANAKDYENIKLDEFVDAIDKVLQAKR